MEAKDLNSTLEQRQATLTSTSQPFRGLLVKITSVAALVSLQLHHAPIELQLRHRFLVLPEHVLGRVPVLSERIMLFELRVH